MLTYSTEPINQQQYTDILSSAAKYSSETYNVLGPYFLHRFTQSVARGLEQPQQRHKMWMHGFFYRMVLPAFTVHI